MPDWDCQKLKYDQQNGTWIAAVADIKPPMSKFSSHLTIFYMADIKAIVNQVLSYTGSPSLLLCLLFQVIPLGLSILLTVIT